jgi:putative flavoprotein involved in K+ transport
MEAVDTIVVGGGQAGLAMSFHLKRQGREHLVLERGRVGERWRSERWDSLRFQSPNWSIELPGMAYDGNDPDGFAHKDDIVAFIERYRACIGAPVMAATEVTSLRRGARGGRFELVTERGLFHARHVVVATGPYQRFRRSPLARALPDGLVQLHAAEYRNPMQLPAGAVLVVGSGASGCQIGDELVEAGRHVHLCVGRHRRVPRRYRSRDIFWWRRALGELDRTADQTPAQARLHGPLITGAHGGYDIDLRGSARRGMTLLGRLSGIAGGTVFFADDLALNLRRGDDSQRDFLAKVDDFVERTGLSVPMAPAADPPEGATTLAPPDRLDLKSAGITAVVWATGYEFAFDWIDLPVFDQRGVPVQTRGETSVPGLYFLGLPWMHCAKSSFLYGVGDDAAHVASLIGLGGSRPGLRATAPSASSLPAAASSPPATSDGSPGPSSPSAPERRPSG